ncbi:MAG: hypothetical protein JM58_00840 [Peptococcaceae bacterium BICA1-8]|nr:MAG: hypothetical protein JM58_00840 [Peptococcaceae bacterium BICA1-8]
MKIKNVSMLFLIYLLLFHYFLSPLSAEPIIPHSIKVGGDNHLPPYMYVNDNGIYKGFSVDIIQSIAIELGLDLELHPMPWYLIPSSMDKGEIVVILGMNQSNSFSDLYNYSEPYLTISEGIFIRQDNNYIVNLEDLASARVAVQKGNIPGSLLKYIDKDALVYVDNQQQGILLLMMGRIDAFVGNRTVGLYTLQKWKQTNFIKLVGVPIEPVKYSFAFKKDEQKLLALFNEGLKGIKANGTYEKIYNKWFGEIIQTPKEIWQDIVYKIIGGLFIIFVIFLIVLRGNQLLKKEIKKRTLELAEANETLKQQNLKILKEHHLKEQILDSIISGVITIEKNGMISFINNKAKNTLQFFDEISEMEGLHYSKTSIKKFIEEKYVIQALKEGKPHINNEKSVEINEEEVIIKYSIYPLKDPGEEASGAIISFRDITQEKKLQENLIRKDKMQSLGQLVAVIAHEIRNPLMAIKTFIDLIPNKIENKRFQHKLIQYVPAELDRLNQLVTHLLEYAKPRPSEKAEFKIKTLLNELLVLFNKKLKERNINLVIEADEDALVFADKQQLKQILINLILNSIQAFQKEGFLKIAIHENEKGCTIEVTDNGCGIPKTYLNKVTDPFFTLKEDGSGLGLSICYQLIKEHGGDISIFSKEKEGTTVYLFLPFNKGRRKDIG